MNGDWSGFFGLPYFYQNPIKRHSPIREDLPFLSFLCLWSSVSRLFHVYSLLRLFTGFISAALIDWKLIVAKATTTANTPAIPNVHQCTGTW